MLSVKGGRGECDYSVAIPAYGRPEHVRATVEAALQQAFPPGMTWEILVNDDCNPTPLADALADFRGRIRFERNERNLGFAGNWNRTLALARGRWVHMLNSDDLVAPQFAAIMWDAIQRAPPGTALVHSRLKTTVERRRLASRLYLWLRRHRGPTDDASAPVAVYRRGIDAARHVLLNGVRHTTVVVRKSAACGIDGFQERYRNFSDEEFYVRLALAGDVAFLARFLVTYRYHDAQLSRRDWRRPEFFDEYAGMYDEIIARVGTDLTADDRARVDRRVAAAGVGVARVQAMHGDVGAAQATLRKARERSPQIGATADYRKAALLVDHRLVRAVYGKLFA